MTYSLVLRPPLETVPTRAIGENVFLADLSSEYKVFAFYYPTAMRSPELETGLRSLGDLTGTNLFVNMGKLDDPALGKITTLFEIHKYPVIVLTATAELGGVPEHGISTYVRLDNGKLLADATRTVTLVQEIYGLFLRGDVADAISKAQWTQRTELLRAVAARITGGLIALGGFVADRDIKISLTQGSFELSKSSH